MRVLSVGLVLALVLAPAEGGAEKEASFGTAVRELRLGLELPKLNATRPCGGLCGLVVGSRVVATFLFQNLSKRDQKLAYELTCSGHELTIDIRRPTAKASSATVWLGKSTSCRANAPIYRTIAAGATERLSLPFVVPELDPAIYEVTARARIVPERGKGFVLTSAGLERPIHR